MSLPLLIFVPLGLLAIVVPLCFVGRSFQGAPLAVWSKYTDDTVLANPAVVAYRPLGEVADDPAVDRVAGAYVRNTTQPLWIGAGGSYLPLRPQGPGVVASPLFPYDGAIQDVAVYNAALTSDVVLLHYHNGNGVAS